MNFVDSIQSGYRNSFNFSGRASRSEFWWFWLFYILVVAAIAVVGGSSDAFSVLYVVWILANLVPLVALAVRRLHDTGRSGWWLLIGLIPLAGLILLVFYLSPTGPDNQWGPGSSASLAETEAALNARLEAGDVPQGLHSFALAKIELARTGKRRVFVCGRCRKDISLAWNKCGHCGATFDEFPPVDTGRVV